MFLREEKFIVERLEYENETERGVLYRDIILRKPAHVDEFGDPIGSDDLFCARAFKDKAKKRQQFASGDRVKAVLILNGKEVIDNARGIFYNTYLNLWRIEKI